MAKEKKLSIRLNGRKNLSLFYGANVTSANIESVVSLKDYNKKNFKPISKTNRFYFNSGKYATHNNAVLEKFFDNCCAIIKDHPDFTPKDIINKYLGKDVKKEEEVTFDAFIKEYINTLRYEQESSTYKKYITVRNNVATIAPEISRMPIQDIDNDIFIKLGDKMLNSEKKEYVSKYHETMKFFKATISKYNKNDRLLTYQWKKYAPASTNSHEHHYIKDVSHVLNFDVRTLKTNMKLEKITLYMDIVRFLYYSISRPIDVITLNTKNLIEGNNNVTYWEYTPSKKTERTYKGKTPEKAKVPVSTKMSEIINKYKDVTGNGYLFPLACNNPDKSKESILALAAKEEGKINKLLKEIGSALNLTYGLTLYDFRKTKITDLCKKGFSVGAIAKAAGTSIQVINKHYLDKDAVLENEAIALMNA